MALPAITFTAAELSDAQELAEIRVEAMRESLERLGRFDPLRARERFLSGYSPERTRHILCQGERVGFFVLKPQDQGLVLDHLYVRPPHQRRGIGATVLTQVFAEADAAGLPVRVGALRGSESNTFYARHGFIQIEQGEFDNYYVRPSKSAL
jgi:GNAT superfamily N-acetyltransferase